MMMEAYLKRQAFAALDRRDAAFEKLQSREQLLVWQQERREAFLSALGGFPARTPLNARTTGQMTFADYRLEKIIFESQPGLHVMDGSVMPANPGVNPSLLITALAERAMSLWPNKGETDTRPPLGSGYERVDPVMPHRPIVPAGAPAELRLDGTKEDLIPYYPY